MIFIIKLALTFFILALMLVAIVGFTFCLQLIQKLDSTIRTIIYSGSIIITLVTLLMNLSFKGIHILGIYIIVFALIGYCSVSIYLWKILINKENYWWNLKVK